MAKLPKLDDVSGPIVAAFLADAPPLTAAGRQGEQERLVRLYAALRERKGKVLDG